MSLGSVPTTIYANSFTIVRLPSKAMYYLVTLLNRPWLVRYIVGHPHLKIREDPFKSDSARLVACPSNQAIDRHLDCYQRKVPEYLTAKVVDFAKIKPQDRFRKITQTVEAYHRSEFVLMGMGRGNPNSPEECDDPMPPVGEVHGRHRINARLGGCNSSSEWGVLTNI
ncbi:hypothetical protein BYT27DRAFT_7312429 [Phlegmacium glaucopus]|nr:hypothetical protein BYT27DRAFT_7312429 [Phlegmacium glaucopus]